EPAEKKSQGDAERHFRFPMYAFTKDDRNFTYAQRSAAAQQCFENNLKPMGSNDSAPSGLRRDSFALEIIASEGWSRRRDSNP
ncbi:MAG TPA: hypothetical protein VNV64_10300, partial [Candidatus Binatia bacterium]|nr:hypothetical protein [Candidatus Binatia bacterium]